MHPILPDATIWALALPGGLLLSLLASATGLPFMALAGQALATARRRIFYDKCARQLAMLAAILAPFTLFMTTLTVVRAMQMEQDLLVGPYRMPILALLALMAGTSLCAVAYLVTWKRLAGVPLLHRLLGLAAGVGGVKTLFIALGLLRALFVPGHPLPASGTAIETMRALLLPDASSLLWASLALALCAAATGAGTLGMQWLVLRRQRDDFGRDHYNFSLPWCAGWTIGGTVVALAPLAYTLWRALSSASPGLTVLPPLAPLAGCIAGPALVILCGCLVRRSSTPLRLKPAITIAVLCCILTIACVLSTLLSLSRFA